MAAGSLFPVRAQAKPGLVLLSFPVRRLSVCHGQAFALPLVCAFARGHLLSREALYIV